MLKAAHVALLEMPSQLLGATDLNGPHHLEMGGWQTMRTAVALPVLAKNVGQLGARLFFSCCPPMFERQQRRRRLSVRESQKVQRTPRREQALGWRNLQVALGTLKRVMAQQRLDGSPGPLRPLKDGWRKQWRSVSSYYSQIFSSEDPLSTSSVLWNRSRSRARPAPVRRTKFRS